MNDQTQDRERKAKDDIIGTLYKSELMELLGFETPEAMPKSLKEVWKSVENYLSNALSEKEAIAADELINSLGVEIEEFGFKKGFRVAMRICMEGMNSL